MLVLLIPMVTPIQTGGGKIGIDLIPETPINYSLIPTVNNSEYWDSHPFSYLADNYVPYTGATKNVDLGSNDLTTTGELKSSYNEISQSSDTKGIKINGYDDVSGENGQMYINSAGSLRIVGSTNLLLDSNDGFMILDSSKNIFANLGDDAGTYAFNIRNSSNDNVFSVDSLGEVTAKNLSCDNLDVTGLTSGSVLFSDGTSVTENNNELFWDNTNHKLGIGTTSPDSFFEIVGTGSGNQMRFTHVPGYYTIFERASNGHFVVREKTGAVDEITLLDISNVNGNALFNASLNVDDNVSIGKNLSVLGKIDVWGSGTQSHIKLMHSSSYYSILERDSAGNFNIKNRGGSGSGTTFFSVTPFGNSIIPLDNGKLLFGAGQDSSISYDGTNMIFISNETGTGLAWFSRNVSSTGFMTRTSVYDKSQGSALDKIKDADELKTNGKINHSAFYGNVKYDVVDYSRPKYKEVCKEVIDEKTNETNIICEDKPYYPYTKTEEGVSLDMEIDLLRQAVYELKQRVEYLEDNCILK